MSNFMDSIQEKLIPFATKLDQNRYLSAIKSGFLVITPFLIIGSFFLLINEFPIPAYRDFMQGLLGENWQVYFGKVNDMTMNLMSFVFIMGAANELAKFYKVDVISSEVVAIISFLILTPITNTDTGNFLPMSYFGAAGLFVAILSTIGSVEIFRFISQKGWTIKMPDSVPPNVSKSFAALIPGLFVLAFFNLIRIGFLLTSYSDAQTFISQFLQEPLMKLGNSLPATLLFLLVEALLWAFGLHGAQITSAITTPIWRTLGIQNAELVAQGLPPENIISTQFYDNFVKLGGSSATIGLALALIFFARSSQYKTLGKLSFIPAIFNINEPLIFGLPVVLNPILIIPFVITPLVMCLITYFAMSTGIVPITNGLQLPWTTPPIISGFLLSGWQGAVLQVLLIATSFGIYFPFLRVEDKKIKKEELKTE
ncbi:PTS sugar transporter subunit IIC [Enterococcus sp. DIV2469a]|uniref:PTS sugar transporter subunit IIC n=1 Tax=unclassified Enterococcus TaxID=2608891 RepID=UPI003F27F2C5